MAETATAEAEAAAKPECETAAPEPPTVLARVFWDVRGGRGRLLIPPLNFAMVSKGVYRSGYPNKKNFAFLRKLGLRSILYLSPEKHADHQIGLECLDFIKEHGVRLFHCGIRGHKEPFGSTPDAVVNAALRHVLDRRNHPILVHCDKGKHRTGCLIGCLRKLQRWSLASIFDEYSRFLPNPRVLDFQFIECYAPGAETAELVKDFVWRA